MKDPVCNRRHFIKGAGLAGLSTLFAGPILALPQGSPSSVVHPRKKQARNLIFLVSDGMNHGTLTLANQWYQRHEGRPSAWMRLYLEQEGLVRALQETASASSVVTDSAAAASSWGCGVRVPNGKINIDASGQARTPLYTIARKHGRRTGLVTSTRVTHATPAGFAANVASRGGEDEIAVQYLEREVDVMLGGGLRQFQAKDRADEVDLLAAFSGKGYPLLRSRDELQELAGASRHPERLLGLFAEGYMPYRIDRLADPALTKQAPSLAEMMRGALDALKQAPQGFLLQVESGRVDHAAHANDAPAILHEQLEFEAAIDLARAFAAADGETLVIVTTDHGTGGLHLNGIGDNYHDTAAGLAKLDAMRASQEVFFARLRQADDPARYMEEQFGLPPKASVLAAVEGYLAREIERGDMISRFQAWMRDETSVGWTTGSHTGDLVELAAFGPGAHLVPAYVQNWMLFGIVCEALGMDAQVS